MITPFFHRPRLRFTCGFLLLGAGAELPVARGSIESRNDDCPNATPMAREGRY